MEIKNNYSITNKVNYIDISELVLMDKNPRKISKENFERLKKSLQNNKEFFEARPIICSNRTGKNIIIAGNQRYRAAKELGIKKVPCAIMTLTEEKEKEINIRDNVELGEWDYDILANEFNEEDLKDWGVNYNSIDTVKEIEKQQKEEATNYLKNDFVFTPFSIIDTTKKEWQERKHYWNILINDKGESRQSTLIDINVVKNYFNRPNMLGVSLLDACLMEMIFKFFAPYNNCNVFDTFAGDTVGGFVCSYLGANFTGIELREAQTKINNERIKEYKNSKYICGDGCEVDKYIENNSQDLYFSCPPYFNLEKYSDLENDLSNQKNYTDFIKMLETAFVKAIKCLKDNRFAIIVMSDIRDNQGNYYPICSDIIQIFLNNGCSLYNELILANSIGTLAPRARQIMKKRKIPRRHQEVLCFYKGATTELFNNFEKDKQIKKLDERIFVFLKGNIERVCQEFNNIKDILILEEWECDESKNE